VQEIARAAQQKLDADTMKLLDAASAE
jgi:hypothetical protein